MRACLRVLACVLSALLGASALLAAADGTLVLSGGGDHAGIWPVLFDRLPGPDAAIVVLAPRGVNAETSRDIEELLEARPGKVEVIDPASPQAAEALGRASLAWLAGDSWDNAALADPVKASLAALLSRGGIVGGGAGGASVLTAAVGGTAGLGRFAWVAPGSARNRAPRILEASPASLCVALDPATAILVRGGTANVIGAAFGRFEYLDGGTLRLNELASGDVFRLAARETGRQIKRSGTVRVAIFSGGGTRAQKESIIRDALGGERFAVSMVGPDEIRAGRLASFDVLVQSGGRASQQAEALGEQGREEIREFVRNGGGYVGFNAGSYLAAADRPYYLRLLNARVVDREHWSRGKGPVLIRFTRDAHDLLGLEARTAQLQFNNSSLLARDAQADLPSYDEVAIYETEIASGEAPAGIMKGTSAMESAPYGNGRVFCSGLHPTANDPAWKDLLQRAVLWTAAWKPGAPQEGR